MITKHLVRLTLFTIGVVAFCSGCVFTRDLFKRTPLEPSEVYDRASASIEKYYIDKTGNGIKLDKSKRPDIRSLVTQLDSSALYLDPEESRILTRHEGGAIGIAMRLKDTSGAIEGIDVRSPARAAGLRKGDRIVEINDISVAGRTAANVLNMLRGTSGSQVKLKIDMRSGEQKTLLITRNILKLGRPIVHRFDEYNIGYLRVDMFWPETPDMVKNMIELFQSEKIQGLILDVRNSHGGSYSTIIEVAQLFLKDGDIVCTLSGKKGVNEMGKVYRAEGSNHYTSMPVVALIDNETYNGAEVLAAALRDNDRALLVGETTASRGENGTLFALGDGSHLQFRTSMAIRLNGKMIAERGIAVDREIILTDKERASLYTLMETAIDGYLGNDANDRQVKEAVSILTGTERSR